MEKSQVTDSGKIDNFLGWLDDYATRNLEFDHPLTDHQKQCVRDEIQRTLNKRIPTWPELRDHLSSRIKKFLLFGDFNSPRSLGFEDAIYRRDSIYHQLDVHLFDRDPSADAGTRYLENAPALRSFRDHLKWNSNSVIPDVPSDIERLLVSQELSDDYPVSLEFPSGMSDHIMADLKKRFPGVHWLQLDPPSPPRVFVRFVEIRSLCSELEKLGIRVKLH